MRELFYCTTGTIRRQKLPLPCSVSPSHNYLIRKACIGAQRLEPLQRKKKQPKSSHQVLLSKPTFVSWQKKLDKMRLVCDRALFYAEQKHDTEC